MYLEEVHSPFLRIYLVSPPVQGMGSAKRVVQNYGKSFFGFFRSVSSSDLSLSVSRTTIEVGVQIKSL
jgi:hypothetical protein